MRIGIFGGTFNPPHKGHLSLARAALEESNLSKVIFVPCGNPPHKDISREHIADAVHRLNMVQLAVNTDSLFDVSDIEIKSSMPSYTAELLKNLKSMYPEDRLCFIMGADSLYQVESWYHPELIFQRAEIIVALRGGCDNSKISDFKVYYENKYGAVISTLTMSEMDISSSTIRDRLKEGKSVTDMLCDNVLQYITDNNIYGV